MKKWFIYILIVFSGLSFQKPVTRWVVIKGSSLKVDGSTNINNFTCEILNYSQPDTIVATRSSNAPINLSGNIKLDVDNFNCHNPVMTADLRKTLKVKLYPKVIIYFISMGRYPDAAAKQDGTKGSVVIMLAGVSKRMDVDYKIVSSDKNSIHLVGSRKVNFSDFNITPPRKLGGMIQTNNELSVVFTLKIKVLE